MRTTSQQKQSTDTGMTGQDNSEVLNALNRKCTCTGSTQHHHLKSVHHPPCTHNPHLLTPNPPTNPQPLNPCIPNPALTLEKAQNDIRRLAELRRRLLTRSGDVETNPGPPQERLECKECQKTITTGPHLICCACGKASHKQKKCSGYTTNQLNKVKELAEWKCLQCCSPEESARGVTQRM